VKRRLVAVGDFKDLRKKVVAQSLVTINRITEAIKVTKNQKHADGPLAISGLESEKDDTDLWRGCSPQASSYQA
jgi:hypothetical protein